MSQFYINTSEISSDRFDMARFMEFTDNYDPLTSKFFSDMSKLKPAASFLVQGEEGRPDLVSKKLFGNDQYWWISLMYNSILKVQDIKSGKSLMIPGLENIEDLLFTINSKVS